MNEETNKILIDKLDNLLLNAKEFTQDERELIIECLFSNLIKKQ
ncbi:MAG: hypothetical protein RR447_07515 [Algoriella sp.]